VSPPAAVESRVSLAAWRDLWRRLGARSDPEPGHRAVIAAYAEPHRHYHTTEHIARTLRLLDEVSDHLGRPAEAELAVWLHDVVYDPRAADNEAQSADLAETLLREGGAASGVIAAVRELILATCHPAPAEEHDARYVVDADLSILGAPVEAFDRYEDQVRREYAFVSEAEWQERRPCVLGRFLERGPIFRTPEFARFEAPARANLARSIARLAAARPR
jgi:predicted metal-dependent HD superfamily phosphohydrolase